MDFYLLTILISATLFLEENTPVCSCFILRPKLVKYFPFLTHSPFLPFYSKEVTGTCTFTKVWETGIKIIFNIIKRNYLST